jgi:hypothetical protein
MPGPAPFLGDVLLPPILLPPPSEEQLVLEQLLQAQEKELLQQV